MCSSIASRLTYENVVTEKLKIAKQVLELKKHIFRYWIELPHQTKIWYQAISLDLKKLFYINIDKNRSFEVIQWLNKASV